MDIYSLILKQWTIEKCYVFIDSLCSVPYWYTLKNKRVNQHLKGPRSDRVFIVLYLPYYPAGANSLKC